MDYECFCMRRNQKFVNESKIKSIWVKNLAIMSNFKLKHNFESYIKNRNTFLLCKNHKPTLGSLILPKEI